MVFLSLMYVNPMMKCVRAAVNAVTRSAICMVGAPCRSIMLVTKNSTTSTVVPRTSDAVSPYLVEYSIATMICLIPDNYVENVPSKSIPTCVKGASGGAIGWRRPAGLNGVVLRL